MSYSINNNSNYNNTIISNNNRIMNNHGMINNINFQNANTETNYKTREKLYKSKTNKKSKETQPLLFSLGLALDTLIKFAYAPVERLQILQQVQPIIPEIYNRPSYLHITSAFKTITKEQGFKSLWRGATAGLVRFMPSHVVNYIIECYDTKISLNKYKKKKKLVELYNKNKNNNSNYSNYNNNLNDENLERKEKEGLVVPIINTLKWLNGKSNLSVAVTMALGYPLNLARVRLAADVGVGNLRKYKSINDCLGHIYVQGGLSCMYNGWIESYLAYILYNYSAKTAYKQSMNYLFGKSISRPPLWKQWFIGQMVTRTAYIFIYPLETVKLRLMMQAGEKKIRYRNGWNCIWRIICDEGFFSLYKGIDVVLLSEIFGWGIIISSGLIMDWLVGKLIGTEKKKENISYRLNQKDVNNF